MEKKWTVKRDCRGLSTNEIINAILEDRGVEDINTLLYPDEDCLIPFNEMKNIDVAAILFLKILKTMEVSLYILTAIQTVFLVGQLQQDGCSSIQTKFLMALIKEKNMVLLN